MRQTSGKRYLIDGSMAREGGGYTYLVNILPRLSKMAPGDQFRVLVRTQRLADALSGMPNVQVDQLPEAGLFERFRFLHTRVPKLAAEWGADLYFSVGEYSPLRMPCPVVAAFRNPNVFTSLNQGWPLYQRVRLKALRMLSWLSAKRADRILFVSQDSANWIGDAIGLPEASRVVVHHGIDAEVFRGELDGPRSDGVILSVSSVYRYKNYVRLIEAYTQLAKSRPETPDLVIVGDDQDPVYQRQMLAARDAAGDVAESIHLVGAVAYEQVKEYYRNASLFVFPSYLETFGHPLLEAMGCDVPVVAADIPVFREIAGDAALYADPFKVESLAAAMEDGLNSISYRKTLVERGRKRVEQFTWERSTSRLLNMFSGLLDAEVAPVSSIRPRRIRQVVAAAALAISPHSGSNKNN
jgi:glycosyltransferase involved in cell wall biosynthesis